MSLGILIINYKTKDLTARCLRSILDQKWQTKIDIYLVDNASDDGSLEYFKEQFPEVNLIESKENLGFAGGNNLALKTIPDDFILLLNSDTEISEGSLDELVNFMDQNNCGIISPKLVGFDGKLQPNSGDFPFGNSLLNWLFNLEIFGLSGNFHRNEEKYYQVPHEVDWVSGGCMMIRREVIRKIGLLNSDYFMYFEDVEFCFRAKKAGFKVMVDPLVRVKHLSGGSSERPEFRQWSGELKNLLKFYRQNFGQGSFVFLKLLVYLATGLRVLAFLLIGKFTIAKTYGKVIATV